MYCVKCKKVTYTTNIQFAVIKNGKIGSEENV